MNTPIGRNTLAKFVTSMCAEAGIREKNSLRASGATAMFTAEVPEKIIKEVTGHKSSKALAIYERPTVEQKRAVSNVLIAGPSSSKSYLDEVRKIQGSSGVPEKVIPPFTQWTIPDQSMLMSSMFNGLNNCNITISPQNFHVHMQPSVP